MKVSVCMGIYNGEKYIEKQLQTIYEQSRTVDEVILCDDGSTDGTVKIVKEFIQKYHLGTGWKLYENTENKGYPGNFYYAMSLCTGDVVFLADQDDVWSVDKVEKMLGVMKHEEHIGLLASRWGIIDQNDNILKEISRGRLSGKEKYKKITIRDILYCNDWPGMCMCYRSEIGKLVLERINGAVVPHDVALGFVTAEMDKFFCMDIIGQYHRRHDNNVAMEEHRARKLLNKERKLLEISIYLSWLQEVLKGECLKQSENVDIIRKKEKLMQERQSNLIKGYRRGIIKQYVENRRDIRVGTMICDLLICRQKV